MRQKMEANVRVMNNNVCEVAEMESKAISIKKEALKINMREAFK